MTKEERDYKMRLEDELTIEDLENLDIRGLGNDARYWDLRRAYGDTSDEVRRHLISCARYQDLI
jgi:hypothetical protein